MTGKMKKELTPLDMKKSSYLFIFIEVCGVFTDDRLFLIDQRDGYGQRVGFKNHSRMLGR